jgi:hypothetical protein
MKIAEFENPAGRVTMQIRNPLEFQSTIEVVYTVGDGPSVTKYSGDSLRNAADTLKIFARALRNRHLNAAAIAASAKKEN